MSAIIIDYRADDEIVRNLGELGITVIKSCKNTQVSPALSGHPDMQICKLPNGIYVCDKNCYEYYKNALSEYDIRLICGTSHLNCNYPNDIAYNVAWIGEWAVHNTNYTDPHIKNCLNDLNVPLLNVSQGYSKCNICAISNNAVITSDEGIHRELVKSGIDVLLICNGHIDIFGWDYGFIGGASGKINRSTLAFYGDITLHPDYEKIKNFCLKYNVICHSLSTKRLMDLGSVISVDSITSV